MSANAVEVARLYTSEQSRLVRLINRIVRNRTTTDDLLHDTFLKLLDKGDLAAIRDHKAYLTRIAQNLAIDHRRSVRDFVGLDDSVLFALADPTPSPETALADRQALALTMKVLATMPPRMRQAFVMHRLGETRLAEIGRRLGISTAHAGRLVMAGYKAVRDGLRKQGAE